MITYKLEEILRGEMSQKPSACIPPPADYKPQPRVHQGSDRHRGGSKYGDRYHHHGSGHPHKRDQSHDAGMSFHKDKQVKLDEQLKQQPRDKFYHNEDDDYFAKVQDDDDLCDTDNKASDPAAHDEEDDDPLDAYMKSIEDEAGKKKPKSIVADRDKTQSYSETTASTQNVQESERLRGIRLDIDGTDDVEESYFKYLEEKKSQSDCQDEDEREDLVEYDKDGNVIGVRKIKREVEPLPPLDHSTIEYARFEKSFYREHDEIRKLTLEQSEKLRAKLEIRVSGSSPPKPVCSFAHFNFDEKLMRIIRKSEYFQPTPIQAQAIPAALLGRNMIGIAMTGSGKTAAYIWPMIVHIMNQPNLEEGDGPIGLVLVPTRELALQVYGEAKKFSNSHDLIVVCAYGGGSRYEQSRDLESGAEIVVATPGRMIDLIKSGSTNLRRVTYLVLDEADRFFEMGFEAQVRSICDHIRPDRQTLLFSATFKHRVEQLARTVIDDPVKIIQKTLGEANEDVTQHIVLFQDPAKKWDWLISKLVEFSSTGSVLIFVTRIANSEEVHARLQNTGNESLLLHGDMEQSERNRVITAFKRKECGIMIATDVAARGLDIPHIRTVINYDVARDIDTHIHRVGRTGRAGSKGDAYTLLNTDKDKEFAGHLVKNLESSNQTVKQELMQLAMRSHTFRKSRERSDRRSSASSRQPHHGHCSQHRDSGYGTQQCSDRHSSVPGQRGDLPANRPRQRDFPWNERGHQSQKASYSSRSRSPVRYRKQQGKIHGAPDDV